MRFCTGPWTHSGAIAGSIFATMIIIGISAWIGYRSGSDVHRADQDRFKNALRSLLEEDRSTMMEIRARTEARLDVLAVKVGRMQAQALRLDALGERLTEMGGLDAEEFNFDREPAIGGPEASEGVSESQDISELVTELSRLAGAMEDREMKLRVLEELIMSENLVAATYPAGRPIKKGWLSSHFGKRIDPITGKRQMHKGLDFAGKKGSDVIAVAAGIVTRAERNAGYGRMIEINHGNGYVTRYGHNSELLVKTGDHVEQGQTIAKMGASGRATGPHVHFEIIRNDKIVNPERFVAMKR